MPTKLLVTVCEKHHNCGCQVAPCCFACPLPDCSYVSEQRPLTVERQQKVQEMRDQGKTAEETARRLGVSVRTVWRALSAS